MGFLRRFAEGLGHSTPVAGIAEAAASWGWEAVDEPFHGGTTDLIHGCRREPCTEPSGTDATNRTIGARRMLYHDAYRGTRDGRRRDRRQRVER